MSVIYLFYEFFHLFHFLIIYKEKPFILIQGKTFLWFPARCPSLYFIWKAWHDAVLWHIAPELEGIWKYFVHFHCSWRKAKRTELAELDHWPDALLHTFLAQSIPILLLCVTAHNYCWTSQYSLWAEWCSVSQWRAPLWRMLRQRKTFLTFLV